VNKQETIAAVISQVTSYLSDGIPNDCTELDLWHVLWNMAEDKCEEIHEANRPPPVPTCPECKNEFLNHGAECNELDVMRTRAMEMTMKSLESMEAQLFQGDTSPTTGEWDGTWGSLQKV